MKKIGFLITGIVLFVAIVIGIASTGLLTLEKEETIKIGVLADLSGDYANALKGVHRGAELAVEELRKDGYNIQLIIEDQQSCNAQETVNALNKLLNFNQVDLIIGGTCSNTTLAAAPIVQEAKTIMISPSSSAPSISQAGEYVFRTYISDNLRAESMSELVYNLGYRKMITITDLEIDSAVEGSKSAGNKFKSLGGDYLSDQGITTNDKDFRTVITKIKEKNPDVVLISVMGSRLAQLSKQIREQGLDVLIVHPYETAEDEDVIKIGGDAVNNMIYVLPGSPEETEKYLNLQRKYFEKYAEDVMPSYTAESYDAVMLGVKAVIESDGTKEDINKKLYLVSKDYKGLSGNTTFDENGDVKKDVIFKQIVNGEFVVYNN